MFFITNSSLDFKALTKFKVRSFVFNMNKVFEDYIFQVIKENIDRSLEIKRFYKIKLFDNTDIFEINPDYLILKENKVELIADAKYKKEASIPDFNQLITYMERFEVSKSLLIYPYYGEKEEIFQKRIFKGKEIHIFYFNLLNMENSESTLYGYISELI